MPIRSQAQARYEFSHPEIFGGKEKVLHKLHAQGGMKSLPKRKKKKTHPLLKYLKR